MAYNKTNWINNTSPMDANNLNKIEDELEHITLTGVKKGDLINNVQDYGAIGDGVNDDTNAIQNCINKSSGGGIIFFPSTLNFYKVSSLTIPDNKHSLKLLGAGNVNSYIKFSSLLGISVQSEGFIVQSLRLDGAGLFSTGSCMIRDERPNNRADFDVTLNSCFVSEFESVVETRGRGVVIEFNLFNRIRYQIIKADFPLLAVFTPSDLDIQKYATGFRGFIFRQNRVHYSPCTILVNKGENKTNLTGVLITGNQLEGSVSYIDGYVKNCEVSSNIHYQCGNVREALFMLHGCENVSIDLNVSGMRVSKDGYDKFCNKLMHCSGVYHNLTIRANVQDVYKDVFYFDSGGTNLDIQVNANNICISDVNTYSLVHLDGCDSIYNGINIRGGIASPGAGFVGVRRNENLVKQYNVDLDITGDFLSYHNLNAGVDGIRRRVCGVYLGNGEASQQITVKYQPALVQVFSNNFQGTKSIFSSTCAPNITINSSGFTAKLTANTSGEIYTYITQ